MLADKVPDVANLAVGALLFGQFFSDGPFSYTLASCGAAMWVILMAWALVLAKERKDL